ncbi:hypothetical protein GCM10010428_64510 [Actinosynnema pretiosum subsp. pretiosum]
MIPEASSSTLQSPRADSGRPAPSAPATLRATDSALTNVLRGPNRKPSRRPATAISRTRSGVTPSWAAASAPVIHPDRTSTTNTTAHQAVLKQYPPQDSY